MTGWTNLWLVPSLEVLGAAVITVVGVVFSIILITLTLASTQFGPRMLRNFIRDRGTQLTLGTFVATFVYAVLVLVSIGPGPDVPEFDGWLTAFEVVDLARSFTATPDGAAVLAALRGPGRCRSLGGHLGRSAA